MITCAFTIVLNGLHHLQHNDYANKLASMVDYWIIVEGASGNEGSTYWCAKPLSQYHKDGRSVDGTCEYLSKLASKHKNIHLITKSGCYSSKDEQVGLAIKKLKTLSKDEQVMLWQVDVDEQWTPECMRQAEKQLLESQSNVGFFFWNFYVGPGLLARGTWGEESGGRGVARLWKWNGNAVVSHEPAVFQGLEDRLWLPQRCNHFAYFYEKDVMFKSLWYKGYKKIYGNWIKVQESKEGIIPMALFLNGIQAVNYKVLKNSWIERPGSNELTISCG
jgi:hypothetical protein